MSKHLQDPAGIRTSQYAKRKKMWATYTAACLRQDDPLGEGNKPTPLRKLSPFQGPFQWCWTPIPRSVARKKSRLSPWP